MKKHWTEIITSAPVAILIAALGVLLIIAMVKRQGEQSKVDPAAICKASALEHMAKELSWELAMHLGGHDRAQKLAVLRKGIADTTRNGCGL